MSDSKDLQYETKAFWEKADKKQREEVNEFAEGYKEFLTEVKTEFEAIQFAVKQLKDDGFKDLEKVKKIKKGDKVYFNYKDRLLLAFRATNENLENGLRVVGSHVDSPRLDLKMRPLVEDSGVCYLKTHYYGGIKKYQWVTRPLALHGFVVLKSGKKVNVEIGEKDDDPVFAIADLLPHMAQKQMEKKASKVVEGEEMKLLFGTEYAKAEEDSDSSDNSSDTQAEKRNGNSISDKEAGGEGDEDKKSKKKNGKDKIKQNILEILNEKYGIEEADLISADLRVVPADKPRDLGLDRSMILAYGHDDRVCAYSSLQAFLEFGEGNNEDFTPVLLFVDKEETGSDGSTGINSEVIYYAIETYASKLTGKDISSRELRGIYKNSQALSSDVSAVVNPVYASVADKSNAAKLGHGVVLTKYTGSGGKYYSSEPSAEYVAWIRKILDKNKVQWQPGLLGKIDQGGGGTIAKYLDRLGISTIDFGTGLLSMHAPLEICSKADLYSTYRAYKVFYKEK